MKPNPIGILVLTQTCPIYKNKWYFWAKTQWLWIQVAFRADSTQFPTLLTVDSDLSVLVEQDMLKPVALPTKSEPMHSIIYISDYSLSEMPPLWYILVKKINRLYEQRHTTGQTSPKGAFMLVMWSYWRRKIERNWIFR